MANFDVKLNLQPLNPSRKFKQQSPKSNQATISSNLATAKPPSNLPPVIS
ncbi:hypothetical protein [Campylobacter sp.]